MGQWYLEIETEQIGKIPGKRHQQDIRRQNQEKISIKKPPHSFPALLLFSPLSLSPSLFTPRSFLPTAYSLVLTDHR
jgi:hypothetical protein